MAVGEDIEIRAPLEPAHAEPGGAVVTAFSGGVDSFYTQWSHAAEQEPDERAHVRSLSPPRVKRSLCSSAHQSLRDR
jgi:hypothetical protein